MELVFPATDLARPLAMADALLHRMMSERIAELETKAPRSLADEVRQLLRTLVFTATCTPRIVGLRLGVPVRTLNRRLAEQGTSVSALRDEVRRDTACQLARAGREDGGRGRPPARLQRARRVHARLPALDRDRARAVAGAATGAAARPALTGSALLRRAQLL